MVDQELLELLVCPLCRAELDDREEELHCTRDTCGCIYPVENGIPIALIDEADRPCPDCGTQREWDPETDELGCPDCGATYSRSA